MAEKPAPEMEFDTITKPQGTFNAKVNERSRWLERERLRKELLLKKKTLPQMEKDAEEVLAEEVVVFLGQEMMDKLRMVFDKVREREKIDGEEIETQEYVHSIVEEPYFESRLHNEVRESVDGEIETLEQLLLRLMDKYKKPQIHWHTFLGFFTRRGRLREQEEYKLKKLDRSTQQELDELLSQITEEDIESKKYRLDTNFRRNIINRKISLVPKTGKGSFNVTVPVPFDGMEAEKKVTQMSIKFQEYMSEKERALEKELNFKYKAKPVPKHVKSNKFEKLMQ